MNYWSLVQILTPEIVIVIAALAVLSLDLFSLRHQRVATRSMELGIAAIIGLVVAGGFLVYQMSVAGSPDHAPGARAFILNGTLVADGLAMFLKLVIVALTILTICISIGSEFTEHVGEYYAIVLFGALGMMFLITSEELITIVASLELLSLSLYILTAFERRSRASTEAGVKYFMFGGLSSAFLIFGLSYLYGITGQTSLTGIGNALAAVQSPTQSQAVLMLGLVFTMVGFGFKVAVVPFHLWAPDAYQGAPTPVTAFIATGSKVASFVVLLKVVMIGLAGTAAQGALFWHPIGGGAKVAAGWVSLLAIISGLSMIVGNVAAIVQRNVKRLLAYSSIAHGGYVLLGMLAANELGEKSVLFYVIVYGLANIGAFGVVQALAAKAGGEQFENFRGMVRRAPFLSFTMLIFVLSLAGIPPLGGFIGKFYLFLAATGVENMGLLWLVILGIAMSAVSLYYYLVLLKQMYVEPATDHTPIRAATQFKLATAIAALAILLLGVFPGPVLKLIDVLLASSSLMQT